MNAEIYSIPQAAKYCSISRGTLWRYVKSGDLKAFLTPGGHHRILRKDLEFFMREKGIYFPERDVQQNRKVLIVDDAPGVQRYLHAMLSANGYAIETAADGFEAGVKTIQFQPDLMILDLYMPGMDGFEVCKQIKSNANTAHIRILAYTGYDTAENQDRIRLAGADGYLVKPAEKKELLENIERLLNPNFFKVAK